MILADRNKDMGKNLGFKKSTDNRMFKLIQQILIASTILDAKHIVESNIGKSLCSGGTYICRQLGVGKEKKVKIRHSHKNE